MQQFADIVQLIQQSRSYATRAVNTELINLYWQVGEYLSYQVAAAAWGDKTISELAEYLATQHPELKGFTSRGLYRMKQFYATYSNSQIVSALLTQLQNSENQRNEIVSSLVTEFKISEMRQTQLLKN